MYSQSTQFLIFIQHSKQTAILNTYFGKHFSNAQHPHSALSHNTKSFNLYSNFKKIYIY